MATSLYKRRIEQGLCGMCGKRPPEPGSNLCAEDKEKCRLQAAKQREKRRKAGLCICPGCKQMAREGRTRCEEHAKLDAEASREEYSRREAEGLCVRLGCKNKPKAGCKLCQSCIDKSAAVASARYAQRKAAGTCYFCDNPRVPGFTLCERHRQLYADYRLQVKIDAIMEYGGPLCAGCRDPKNSDIATLEIDHIDGGGRNHFREEGITGGYSFYLWLKRNNYPKGFRVLCPLCNKRAHLGTALPSGAPCNTVNRAVVREAKLRAAQTVLEARKDDLFSL